MPPAGAPAPRFPYEDPSLPVDQRMDDLLPRLDRADRIGLLFHPHGGICDPAVPYEEGRLPLAQQIRELRISHFALQGTAADARQMAAWHNHLQGLAAEHPLRIPITLSSDPRHSSEQNLLTSEGGGAFSTCPDHPGMAALGDASVTERYADIVRREYRAVGIRVGLHPQIDLATEPRWGRIVGGFSESADLTSRMSTAYIRGLQGAALGPGSVAAMTKHFPGGGPQKDGLDPHFPDGREQIYPGGMRELHLEPFRAAIAAGTAQIMPYYGMPVKDAQPFQGHRGDRAGGRLEEGPQALDAHVVQPQFGKGVEVLLEGGGLPVLPRVPPAVARDVVGSEPGSA